MVIVQLLAPAAAGGLERVVQGLAIGQRDRGHRVVVAAVVHEPMVGHPFRAPLDRAGIEVREILIGHRAYGEERRAVTSLCVELKADVVHSHGYRPDLVNGGALRGLGIATVSTNHGATRGPLLNRVYEYVHRRLLKRFDAVIAVSEQIATELTAAGVPRDRLHVVPNGWIQITEPASRDEARRVLGLAEHDRVVGWVGRLSQEKGIDVFVDALAQMGDSGVTACIIGDGPEREREHGRTRDARGARIIWAGMIPEAAQLCRAFDVFVLSSRSEGTPIALLEAMATGTPVVATRVGGVPNVISEREALLVPSEQPEALASAIANVFSDPASAAERAKHATARLAAMFDRDRWLDHHDRIYALAQRLRRADRKRA